MRKSFRGVEIPDSLDTVVIESIIDGLEEREFTCNVLLSMSYSSELLEDWGSFLTELGISLNGAGFSAYDDPEVKRIALYGRAPPWVLALGGTPKARRVALLRQLLNVVSTENE